MKPTLEQMKMAVAKMLPDVLWYPERAAVPEKLICWRDGEWQGEFIRDTEWLHVCWLAEQGLNDSECRAYNEALIENRLPREEVSNSGRWSWGQPLEVRLIALCRVKCPGMFAQQEVAA